MTLNERIKANGNKEQIKAKFQDNEISFDWAITCLKATCQFDNKFAAEQYLYAE